MVWARIHKNHESEFWKILPKNLRKLAKKRNEKLIGKNSISFVNDNRFCRSWQKRFDFRKIRPFSKKIRQFLIKKKTLLKWNFEILEKVVVICCLSQNKKVLSKENNYNRGKKNAVQKWLSICQKNGSWQNGVAVKESRN